MRLTVVGCSGSVSGPDAPCSCYLVEENGYRLLLDSGDGSAGPLQRYVNPVDIDTVIISHAHEDHCGALKELVYLRTLVDNSAPLQVVGPSDMPAVLRRNPEVFTAIVAEPGVVELGPVKARLAPVDHAECWATRIGDALCYTADTGMCETIEELADGCAVLLAEASGSDVDGPLSRHLTAGDAGRLAARAGARLLVLTHLRPWQNHLELLEEAAREAPTCQVILANPGLRIAL